MPAPTQNNETELAERVAKLEAERDYDKLLRDIDNLREEDETEQERLTPELRAQAKDLAEATKAEHLRGLTDDPFGRPSASGQRPARHVSAPA